MTRQSNPDAIPGAIERRFLCALAGLVILLLLPSVIPEVGDFLILPAIEIARYTVGGWIGFLKRVLPSVQIDRNWLLLAATFVGLVTSFLHRQIRKWQAPSHRPWRLASTAAVVALGLGSCVAAICLVGAVHELLWIARANGPVMHWASRHFQPRRTQSKNNLKQIGLAFSNYHDSSRSFPPGGVLDRSGLGQHGWMTFVLPYVDQAPLYQQINWSLPWNDPVQQSVFATVVPMYQCPGPEPFFIEGYAAAWYSANKLVLGANLAMSIGEITDGTSNTIVAGEVNDNLKPWGHPVNYRDVSRGINRSHDGFGSSWIGGAQFLLADGSVRFINENIDPNVLQSLATPAGGEPPSEY